MTSASIILLDRHGLLEKQRGGRCFEHEQGLTLPEYTKAQAILPFWLQSRNI